jgi:hypothetical protein
VAHIYDENEHRARPSTVPLCGGSQRQHLTLATPPEPLKPKLAGEQIKLHGNMIRIGPDSTVVQEDSQYGTPIAICDMLHNV